ncbi:hypothetical protein GCM10007301_21050 [Azorhizobium oxalatiphilum]|uniref:Efflux RND transporter periplasmic adaptor subunit n=1 Tax=Azorhizobium oxalatiphilum TaxID=980631 RepID=A0A917BXA6_9HYPH|nr:efflux RND transporter periplasmic adaptor subunit [Azorhizobium oxalatiphilum]GGF61054.1 hypothetical protein GCM10007301_21050 [Azorhizobium oxalatiphilum]
MRRVLWVVAAVVAIAGGVMWRVGVSAQEQPAPSAKPQAPAIPVVAEPAKAQDMPVYASGIGAVQAYNSVTVKVRVDGELHEVLFKEGQEVKQGEVIAQIDPRTYKAALAQAEATKAKDEALLANARLDLARYQTLVDKNAASQQSLDTQKALVAQYQAAVQGDQAAIDNAQVQLGFTTIKAPISGRTGVRLVDEGNIVRTTDTTGLVVITQLKPISVIFALPQERLDEVRDAMARGPVAVEAFRRDGTTLLGEGQVALIDNQISADTGTLRIKATFPNDGLKLWPGAFVNVKVRVNTIHDAVTVPSQVVQRGPDGLYLYVVTTGNTVEKRTVTVASALGPTTVITSGLKAGERVVVDGQLRLTPGARVNVVPPKGGAGEKPAETVAGTDEKRA